MSTSDAPIPVPEPMRREWSPTEAEIREFRDTMPATCLDAIEGLEEAAPPGRAPRFVRLVYQAAARVRAVFGLPSRVEEDRRFPVKGELSELRARNLPATIPWAVAELALIGSGDASEPREVLRLAARGGMTPEQLDARLPRWTSLASTEDRLRGALAGSERRADALERALACLENAREALIREAQGWAMEARTQRATVRDVGDALGGVPDWGPIASGVRFALEHRRATVAAARDLVDVVELAGFRALAADGPVEHEFQTIQRDEDLDRRYGEAYRRLRAAIGYDVPDEVEGGDDREAAADWREDPYSSEWPAQYVLAAESFLSSVPEPTEATLECARVTRRCGEVLEFLQATALGYSERLAGLRRLVPQEPGELSNAARAAVLEEVAARFREWEGAQPLEEAVDRPLPAADEEVPGGE